MENGSSSIGIGYADQSAKQADRRPGNVSALIDQLSATQSELYDRVNLLGERLGNVLRTDQQEPGVAPKDDVAVRSGLADQIMSRIDVAANTLSRINDLLDRLDL